MAHAVEVAIATGNKVSLNYQSQEVAVTVTYRLEPGDGDVLAVVREKTSEVVAAHSLAWRCIKGETSLVTVKTEAVERSASEAPIHLERSTSAQVGLIRSLWRQAGQDENELNRLLQSEYGCDEAEGLDREQAARLLLQLGQRERERFEQKRGQPSAEAARTEPTAR